jgi:hypothetical protein
MSVVFTLVFATILLLGFVVATGASSFEVMLVVMVIAVSSLLYIKGITG